MRLSIIIPTFNEEKNIGKLIDNLRLIFDGEIIVVDGGSTDGTISHIKQNDRTKLYETNLACRAAQLNLGAEKATGDLFLFIHADTKLHQSALSEISEAITQGYLSGCFSYWFDSNSWLLKLNAFFTAFSPLVCRGGDQTLFITKKLFESVGGFDNHYVIMEDFDIIQKIKKQTRFKIINRRIKVSARKYENNSWLKVQAANFIAFTMFRLKYQPSQIKKTYKRLLN